MGIFELWMLWRNNRLLEQIRRNQLTPAERAAEDKAQAKAEDAGSIMALILIALIAFVIILSYFMHFMHGS